MFIFRYFLYSLLFSSVCISQKEYFFSRSCNCHWSIRDVSYPSLISESSETKIKFQLEPILPEISEFNQANSSCV